MAHPKFRVTFLHYFLRAESPMNAQPRATPWERYRIKVAPWKGKSVFSISSDNTPCICLLMHAMPVFNAFAPVGRSFTCACIPMALPWAMCSLGFQPVK